MTPRTSSRSFDRLARSAQRSLVTITSSGVGSQTGRSSRVQAGADGTVPDVGIILEQEELDLERRPNDFGDVPSCHRHGLETHLRINPDLRAESPPQFADGRFAQFDHEIRVLASGGVCHRHLLSMIRPLYRGSSNSPGSRPPGGQPRFRSWSASQPTQPGRAGHEGFSALRTHQSRGSDGVFRRRSPGTHPRRARLRPATSARSASAGLVALRSR